MNSEELLISNSYLIWEFIHFECILKNPRFQIPIKFGEYFYFVWILRILFILYESWGTPDFKFLSNLGIHFVPGFCMNPEKSLISNSYLIWEYILYESWGTPDFKFVSNLGNTFCINHEEPLILNCYQIWEYILYESWEIPNLKFLSNLGNTFILYESLGYFLFCMNPEEPLILIWGILFILYETWGTPDFKFLSNLGVHFAWVLKNWGALALKGGYGYVRRSRPLFEPIPLLFRPSYSIIQFFRSTLSINYKSGLLQEKFLKNVKKFQIWLKFQFRSPQNVQKFQFLRLYLYKKKKNISPHSSALCQTSSP